MRQKLTKTAVLICLALLCIMTFPAHNNVSDAASDAATTWEHLALTSDLRQDAADREVGPRINQLGRDGWQLVDVENIHEAGTTIKAIYYFKRES